MALVSLPIGCETFTHYYVPVNPRWQQKLPGFQRINRLMAAFGTLIFFAAVLLAPSTPHDWRFAALNPNLLFFGVGKMH